MKGDALRGIVFLVVLAQSLAVVNVFAANGNDSIAVASNCLPVPNEHCNLRSAWAACSNSPACTIHLPTHSTNYINAEYNNLVLQNTSHIELLGHNSKIVYQPSTPASSDGDDTSAFPLVAGMLSNGSSIMACAHICSAAALQFSTCSDDPVHNVLHDSQLSLYSNSSNNLLLLAFNDDYCYYSSAIYYTRPDPSVCESYCVAVRCFGSSSCEPTVTMEIVPIPVPPSRFIQYEAPDVSDVFPQLTIRNVTIEGFTMPDAQGGAMYLNGPVQLLVTDSYFVNNTAATGGAVFISNNHLHPRIVNTRFAHCQAEHGGAVAVSADVLYLSVTNCSFAQCHAVLEGGGIYMDSHNHNAIIIDTLFEDCTAGTGGGLYSHNASHGLQIVDSQFVRCTAHASAGGGLRINEKHANVGVHNTKFVQCTAKTSGGGLRVGEQNHHMTVSECAFRCCTAELGGGGLALYASNTNAVVRDSTFAQCTSVAGAGGAVHVVKDNLRMQVLHCAFTDCAAGGGGGALATQIRNHDLIVADSQFSKCVAVQSYGGAINLQGDNERVTIVRTNFEHCSADRSGGAIWSLSNAYATVQDSIFHTCTADKGGGIYIERENLHFSLVNSTLSHCAAKQGGGGLYLNSGNHRALIRSTEIVSCTAQGGGGGIYLDIANDECRIEDTLISQCSAVYGAGLFTSSNSQLTVHSTTITHCAASLSGGAIMLFDYNIDVRIVLSVLNHNSAGTYGGAIASEKLNTQLTLAGSEFRGNRAGNNGGAVYLARDNPSFLVIDAEGYEDYRVIDSPHPYEHSAHPLIAETITVPNATACILSFDAQTRVAQQDIVQIYTDSTKSVTLYFSASTDSWPGILLPPLRLETNTFYIEMITYADQGITATSLSDGLFGIKLHVTPVVSNPSHPCLFENNVAAVSGGGIFLFSAVLFPVVVNSQFLHNTADEGGAIYARNAIIGMTIENCEFARNAATEGNGGAIMVNSASYGLRVENTEFCANTASLSGGAVAFTTNNGNDGDFVYDNENTIHNCNFTDNHANVDGGALYADLKNIIMVSQTLMRSNSAYGDGGAVMAVSNNGIRLEACVLEKNHVLGSGGGIASMQQNRVIVTNCTLRNNYANRYGGAVYIVDRTDLLFFRVNTLHANAALLVGGAIALLKSVLFLTDQAGQLTISNSWSYRGSAMYFNALDATSGRSLLSVTFVNNIAYVGGTVYWVFDANMKEEPPGIRDPSVIWERNYAQYGNVTATQALRISAPSAYEVTEYGAFLSPPLVLTLHDYYGQLLAVSGGATIQTSIADASAEQCGGRFPYLSGTDVLAAGVVLTYAEVRLQSLAAACAPDGAITLQFYAQLTDLRELTISDYAIVSKTAVTFRSCVRGEVIVNGECVTCPRGTYSLEDTVTVKTQCVDCLEESGVNSCSGSQIVLNKNHWRRQSTSVAVLPCLSELSGCAGGNQTGDSSCAVGYEGPLCSVCSEGYYRSDQQCLSCGGRHPLSPAVVFYITIAAMVAAAGAFFVYRKVSQSMKSPSLGEQSFFENVASWLKKQIKSFKVQLKIVITTYQITSTIPSSMSVVFPHLFGTYLSAMSVFNLNIVSVLPISCGNSSFTFIDKMIMITLAPIFASIVLFIAYILEYTVYTARTIGWGAEPHATLGIEQEAELNTMKSKIVSRYLTLFFFLTYLVLPAVSTTIFKTFLCTDIDPDNEDPDQGDLFLTADMRVSCSTDYYRRGVLYASIMIVVYVVGIPAMYLYLLWRCRDAIRTRFDRIDVAEPKDATSSISGADAANISEENAQQPRLRSQHSTFNNLATRSDPAATMALMISFLYEAYEPKYWYWEVIETTRRLMLTAVLSVCGAGTSAQAILAILLALMYIKLYGYFNPYVADADDIVAETGQFQIFLSFLGALIYQRQLLGQGWNSYISVCLILINTAVFWLTVYFAGSTLVQEIRESKTTHAAYKHGLSLIKPLAVALPAHTKYFASTHRVAVANSEHVTETHDEHAVANSNANINHFAVGTKESYCESYGCDQVGTDVNGTALFDVNHA